MFDDDNSEVEANSTTSYISFRFFNNINVREKCEEVQISRDNLYDLIKFLQRELDEEPVKEDSGSEDIPS